MADLGVERVDGVGGTSYEDRARYCLTIGVMSCHALSGLGTQFQSILSCLFKYLLR